MSAAFPGVKLDFGSVSPQLADAVKENLNFFTKVNKLVIELTQKFSLIQNEAANSLFATTDTFNKRLTELSKSNKGKIEYQSESYMRFVHKILEQMENQGKILQHLSKSMIDCVITPVTEVIDHKKQIWQTCYHYVDSFYDQIHKKEDDLVKRYKDYSDASIKSLKVLTSTTKNDAKKELQIVHNTHNTYLLRLSSVNSMNELMYTHVLPHVMYGIERNQSEVNDSLRHHLKYMYSIQKETLKKLSKSVDKLDHAADKIDIVSDQRKFIKHTNKDKIHDKSIPVQEFMQPASDNKRGSIAAAPIAPTFILNRFTHPNLQRRLASLQYQTSELVDNISTIRSGESQEIDEYARSDDPSLRYVVELLFICDKEANLNVLLKQMELYSSLVIDFLGPPPENLLDESRHSRKSPLKAVNSINSDHQQAHEFIVPKLMKPTSCYYCSKLITFTKGYVCKICKMCVHKKCSTNAPFCGGMVLKESKPGVEEVNSKKDLPGKSSGVFDLIDLESDDDFNYYDDDEFDDGLSSDDDDSANSASYDVHSASYDVQSHHNTVNNYSVQQQSSASTPVQQYSASDSYSKPTPNVARKHSNSHDTAVRRHSRSSLSDPPLLDLGAVLNKSLNPPPYTANHKVTPVHKKLSESLQKPLVPNKKPPVTQKPSVSKKPVISATKPTVSKKPNVEKKTPPALPTRNVQLPGYCVTLYDYKSTDPANISFIAGAKIEVNDSTTGEWWLGTLNGFQGYFPSQYVTLINENDQVLRCVFDFNGEDEKELSVYENDILVLLTQEDDWFKVRSIDKVGLVPASYVEHI